MSAHMTRPIPWRKLYQRIRFSLLTIDTCDLSKTLLLCGSARSGTTWIAEMLNRTGSFRYIFEPFHPERVSSIQHFAIRQYFAPGHSDPRDISSTEALLAGQIKGGWTDQFNTVAIPRRRLIKDVRVNLLVPWLREHFPELKIAFVLRHPCAVALSRMHYGWPSHLDAVLAQPRLMEDHLQPFRSILHAPHSTFEQHVLLWCIEQYVPLQRYATSGMLIERYEDYCEQPGEAFDRLFRFIDMPLTDTLLRTVRTPSSVAATDAHLSSGHNAAGLWRKRVSADELRFTNDMLELFKLTTFYPENS